MEDLGLGSASWSGRRVFVTGHTGFKGSWLCLWLGEFGARVAGYALAPPSEPSLYGLARVESHMSECTVGDIRNLPRLRAAIAGFRPELVFHLAAQSLVGRSFADPFETLSVNVIGTANLLEAARGIDSVRAVVVATSDKCYAETVEGAPRREGDCLGGTSPYAISKACAEVIAESYRNSGLLGRVATARAGNVIGGGDYAEDRLVPDIVRAAARRKPVKLRRPAAVRPWQHVLDPLAGYLRLAQMLAAEERFAGAWNFGPFYSDCRPVRWVAARVAAELEVAVEESSATYLETAELRLDASKALRELGWKPLLGIEETIDWTADWYRAQAQGSNAHQLSLTQIRAYTARVT